MDSAATAPSRQAPCGCKWYEDGTTYKCLSHRSNVPRWRWDDLRVGVEASNKSLAKIGDGDWTPQDAAHLALVAKCEALLQEVESDA